MIRQKRVRLCVCAWPHTDRESTKSRPIRNMSFKSCASSTFTKGVLASGIGCNSSTRGRHVAGLLEVRQGVHVVGVVALVTGLLAVEGVVSEVRVVAVEVGVEAVVSDVKLVGRSIRCGSSSSTRGRTTGNGSICIGSG